MKKILFVFVAFLLVACGAAAQEPPTPRAQQHDPYQHP